MTDTNDARRDIAIRAPPTETNAKGFTSVYRMHTCCLLPLKRGLLQAVSRSRQTRVVSPVNVNIGYTIPAEDMADVEG